MNKYPIKNPSAVAVRLCNRAPTLAAALYGIETIAEVISAAMTADADPSAAWSEEVLTENRRANLLAAAGVLADLATTTLMDVIGPENDGDSRLTWGSRDHLTGDYWTTPPG